MRYGLREDFRSCFYVRAFVSLMTDRQDQLKRLNLKCDMQRLFVSVSYFLNEWKVSSVLYVLYLYCTFLRSFGGFYNAISVGFWGSAPDPHGGACSAPPYLLAGLD